MKEIRFISGFPFEKWTAVGELKKKKLPYQTGGKTIYLAKQLRILEGECKGMEVSPLNPNIEIRKRKVIYGK